MNRRGFFRRTVGAVIAAACAPLLAKGIVSPDYFNPLITDIMFKGVRVTVDPYCQADKLYILNVLNTEGIAHIRCAPNVLAQIVNIEG